MMNGFYGGMGAGAWVLMVVFWVALIALIVWLVATLLPRGGQAEAGREFAERPEEILDRRLAAGEIDAETYDALSAKLRSAHAARG
jgi:putative membrane protein